MTSSSSDRESVTEVRIRTRLLYSNPVRLLIMSDPQNNFKSIFEAYQSFIFLITTSLLASAKPCAFLLMNWHSRRTPVLQCDTIQYIKQHSSRILWL